MKQASPVVRICFGVFLMGWSLALDSQAALEWQAIPGGRSAPVTLRSNGRTGFQQMAPEATGVWFTNQCAANRHLTNQILLNGAGLAAGDVDGDGWCDLYFCSLDGPNILYRNRGNWRFDDITATAGVACPDMDATGAAFADVDGDGDLDLLVNSIGAGTHVFLNNGKGRFQEQLPPLNGKRGGTSSTLGDIDGDGDLDLYVANYRTVTLRDQPNTRFTFKMIEGKPVATTINDKPVTDPEYTNRFTFKVTMGERGGSVSQEENGEADQLYRNDGAGRFSPVAFTDGTFLDEAGKPLAQAPFDWGLSVLLRDLNGDGAPDLYVCNDFRSPDRIWMNDGQGRFRAIAPLAIRQTCLSTMGLDVADINRDGHDDILLLDMLSRDHARRLSQRIDIRPELLGIGQIDHRPQYPRNMLQLGRGDGTYAEVAQMCGLEATEWSWTPIFLDVDLDGWEDLLVTTGFERDNMNVDLLRQIDLLKKQQKFTSLEQLRLRKMFPRLEVANLAFRNLGNGTFQETGAAWGFDAKGISQGMVVADLDNDGDLDVAMNNFNGVAGLFRNESTAPRIGVKLKGVAPNTQGIGARLRVTGGPVEQSQQIVCGGRYLGTDEAVRVFAAGSMTNRLTIEVKWRSGRRSRLANLEPNRYYEIDEAQASQPAFAPVPVLEPLFEDMSHLLGHKHGEELFDDFARQPLLPRRLSQLGPGVAWFDLDKDGDEDLVIGSGRGGKLAAFKNDGRGGFAAWTDERFSTLAARDVTGIACAHNGEEAIIVAGESNYEDGATNEPAARVLHPVGHTPAAVLPGWASSTGPVVLGDIDADGDLDLFIGGRVVPGRYAEPADSALFRRTGKEWVYDRENSRVLAGVGLVTGAVMTELNGDGYPELVLACEWGPVRIFQNTGGHIRETTDSWGLQAYTGWWTGVSAGDLDGDGRMDLVAANWGRNTLYEQRRGDGLRLYSGDVDGNGTVESIEAYFDQSTKRLLPIQPFHVIGAALPLVREQLRTCMAYAEASLEKIYPNLHELRESRAHWLESTVFLNRGRQFEAKPLPAEAQQAPAFAVCVSDMDGDGAEDVFLSQNFFANPVDVSRYDAGRGLWLKGDGRGGLVPVPGQRSGIQVYGEQRGAAVCDYDKDGRLDLVVTQNGADTKLYRNRGAKPGVRVRLTGPANNPDGIGAMLRVGRDGKWGPARELHAGAGYWSQDGVVQVLSVPKAGAQIQVRWPGGKVTTHEIPSGLEEIAIQSK